MNDIDRLRVKVAKWFIAYDGSCYAVLGALNALSEASHEVHKPLCSLCCMNNTGMCRRGANKRIEFCREWLRSHGDIQLEFDFQGGSCGRG